MSALEEVRGIIDTVDEDLNIKGENRIKKYLKR